MPPFRRIGQPNLHCGNVGYKGGGGVGVGNSCGGDGGNGSGEVSDMLADFVESARRRNTAVKMNISVYVLVFCKREQREIGKLFI